MISVIICSINKTLATQVQQSIAETIGVEWEFILLDNNELKKSITAVYNLGASRARYSILCFVHEDVLFKTNNWGKLVAGYFASDSSLGAIGIAGSKYKSKTPSGWSAGIPALDCCNILHVSADGSELRLYSNPKPEKKLQPVVTLDGVFICSSKEAWEKTPFNEELLTGFHLYDIDFSYAVSASYTVCVTYEIAIVHLTEGGSFGNQWINYTLLWHDANNQKLPRYAGTGKTNFSNYERTIRKSWLNRLSSEKISLRNKFRWLLKVKVYKDVLVWPYVGKLLLYPYIKPVIQLFKKKANFILP